MTDIPTRGVTSVALSKLFGNRVKPTSEYTSYVKARRPEEGKAAAAEVSLHSHADHCVHIKSVINIVHTGRGRESNRGPRSVFEVISQLRSSGRCFET